MRKSMLSILILVTLAALSLAATAQQRKADPNRASPNAEATAKIGSTDVRITYGAPSVKGREIWGGLVPYGQVWRTGANEATTITFSTAVKVEGQPLAAGTYGLFTIPGESEWTIVFNKTANQWGAFNYDAAQDALRVKVKPAAAEHTEQMTFRIEGAGAGAGRVVLQWEKLRVAFRVESAA